MRRDWAAGSDIGARVARAGWGMQGERGGMWQVTSQKNGMSALGLQRVLGLARPAWHRHGEQAAATHCTIDLVDHAQMIVRPREVEHVREVRLAEPPEAPGDIFAARPSRWIDHRRNVTDVLGRAHEFRIAIALGLR